MVWGTGFFKGMWVTLRASFRSPVTINYPEERFELAERARWAVRPLYDDDGAPTCTACMNCVRECPDGVLQLDVTTDEDKNKHIESFTYEVGACMFCGLCVEKCPFAAIEMSHDYELATSERSELFEVLVSDTPAAKPKRKSKPEKKPESDAPAEGGEAGA